MDTVPQLANRIISIFVKVMCSPSIEPIFKVFAKRIHHWLNGYFHRRKIALDPNLPTGNALPDEDQNVKLQADKKIIASRFHRFWGGFTLTNDEDIPHEQILIPRSFGFTNNEHNEALREYESRLYALNNLEKVITVLSNVEPENFESSSRVIVYGVLLDYSMVVSKFTATVKARQAKSSAKLNELKEYGGYLPNAVVPVLEPAVIENKSTRCIFTRIKVKNCPAHLKFVHVPKEYQAQPPLRSSVSAPSTALAAANISNPPQAEGGGQVHDYLKSATDMDEKDGDGEAEGSAPRPVVALEKALLRLISVREMARMDQQKYESKLPELLQVLQEKRSLPAVADYEAEKPLSFRSMPLGYDRHGNSYWLLGAQEAMTIFPLLQLDNSPTKPIEPCLLIREASGWWGYHNGHDLKSLVSILSIDIPSEKVLRECLLERLVFTKRVLFHGTLKFKLVQQEFLERRARAERWLTTAVLGNNLSDVKKATLIETVWARCAEVRMLMHYSLIFKYEEDFMPDRLVNNRVDREAVTKRLKVLRDSLLYDSFDHHPAKGWLRLDSLTRIRELSTTTTACRILADSSIFPPLQNSLSKSPFLKRLSPPSSTFNEVEEALEAKEEELELELEALASNATCSSQPSSVNSKGIPAPEQLLEKLYSKHSHTKCIEQLHPVTGEVLRVYPSGKDAAQFMNVTQSGISLCTSGLRPDCYGFRWRIYEGPPIDCNLIHFYLFIFMNHFPSLFFLESRGNQG